MIKLAQIMKDRTYPESGSVLYDSIAPLIRRGEKVALDLDGVIALPSMFLNASIGMAASEFGADAVKRNVVFYHVSKIQAERLREYFSRL